MLFIPCSFPSSHFTLLPYFTGKPVQAILKIYLEQALAFEVSIKTSLFYFLLLPTAFDLYLQNWLWCLMYSCLSNKENGML